VLLLREISFNLFGKIVYDDDEPIDRRQRADNPVENRPALHFEQRLWRGQRVRAQARSQSGSKYHGVHRVVVL
jgi:hypothetical protein